jgi:GNAT superfamily N-acetyltransferase
MAGVPVTVAGDLSLSLFPWAGLAFTDLRIGNPGGFHEREMLSVAGFEARVKLLPLLSRDVQVKRLILDRTTGEKYGSAALLPMPVEERETDYSLVVPGEMPPGDIEIGYYLKRSAWGRGYATEASSRLLDFAFEEGGLLEVVATFDKRNLASRRVLEKVGFKDHGTMRCYGSDGMNFRITRDEWLQR